jgi:hypothetical protein
MPSFNGWEPARYDWRIKQGQTWKPLVRVPWDLTGFGARLQIRDGYEAALPTFSLVQGAGITVAVLGPTESTMVPRIESTPIAALDLGGSEQKVYVYDWELVEPGGDVLPFFIGDWIVRREAAR